MIFTLKKLIDYCSVAGLESFSFSARTWFPIQCLLWFGQQFRHSSGAIYLSSYKWEIQWYNDGSVYDLTLTLTFDYIRPFINDCLQFAFAASLAHELYHPFLEYNISHNSGAFNRELDCFVKHFSGACNVWEQVGLKQRTDFLNIHRHSLKISYVPLKNTVAKNKSEWLQKWQGNVRRGWSGRWGVASRVRIDEAILQRRATTGTPLDGFPIIYAFSIIFSKSIQEMEYEELGITREQAFFYAHGVRCCSEPDSEVSVKCKLDLQFIFKFYIRALFLRFPSRR